MIRVGEFSAEIFEKRKKFWIENLKLPLQWVDFSAEALTHPEALLKSAEVDGVLMPALHSEIFLSGSARIPTEVREAGVVDSIIRQNGTMWIRCFLREALHQLILERASRLDTHSIAYVTGSDSIARLCIVVAVQMGFQKIVLISESQDEAQNLVQQLQKLFFSLEFTVLHESELTLQPNNGSLLLNTLSADIGSVVFEDLTYLNFLKKEGLVVDLPMGALTNPLLDEAEHVGIRHLASGEIWGLRDLLFLRTLSPQILSLSEADYLKAWTDFLRADVSPASRQ
jgi:hypothetical protein